MMRQTVGAVLVAVLALVLNVGPARPPTAAAAQAGVRAPAKTVLSIVAHEDDDLLFMNPAILSDVRVGYATWTVYLTDGRRNGDPGRDDPAYTDRRIAGLRAAYATMAGVPNRWIFEARRYAGHEVATNRLEGTNVRLAFLSVRGAANCCHFGDPFGDLFRMLQDPAFVARPIDGRAPYTFGELTATLRALIAETNPDYLRTPYSLGHRDTGLARDHCDHTAAAIFAGYADTDAAGATLRPRHEFWHYRTRTAPDNRARVWQAPKYRAWEAYVDKARDMPGAYAWQYGMMAREYAPADREFPAGSHWQAPTDFVSCTDAHGVPLTLASWAPERGWPVAARE